MSTLQNKIISIIGVLEDLVPRYMSVEEDKAKANGSVAVCIIDPAGNIHGRIFGEDKILGRERYRIAWLKASQVWITGIATGEFEKMVFTGQINERKFGLRRPDFIGWEGGQAITLKDGTVLSAGFSGFRSSSDLEIVVQALQAAGI